MKFATFKYMTLAIIIASAQGSFAATHAKASRIPATVDAPVNKLSAMSNMISDIYSYEDIADESEGGRGHLVGDLGKIVAAAEIELQYAHKAPAAEVDQAYAEVVKLKAQACRLVQPEETCP